MTDTERGDFSCAYVERGAGRAIMFIHGHPFNRSMWDQQIDEFSRDFRVIAPDLRGYGRSTIADTVSWDVFAADVEALLDTLDVDQCVLCGMSMAGQIALECYRQFPERIEALVLADTAAQGPTEEERRQREAMADRLLRDGMEQYAETVISKMMSPANVSTLPDKAALVMAMMKGTNPRGAAAALRARARRPDYVELLSEITVPTLIIVGSEDEFTPIVDAEFIRERVTGSELAVIEGAGHMPNLERTDEFNRVLLQFLSQLR